MEVCREALELNGRLISTDQLLYHDDLKNKFQQMEEKLAPYQYSEAVSSEGVIISISSEGRDNQSSEVEIITRVS